MVNTQYILTDALSQFKAFLKIFYQETIEGGPRPIPKVTLSQSFLNYKYQQLEQLVDWMETNLLGGRAAKLHAEASSDIPAHQQIPQTMRQLKKTVRRYVQYWDQQDHVRASNVDERFKRRLSKLEYTAHLFINNYTQPSSNAMLEQQLSLLLSRFNNTLQRLLQRLEERGTASY
jgi:hypothetical protein